MVSINKQVASVVGKPAASILQFNKQVMTLLEQPAKRYYYDSAHSVVLLLSELPLK